MFANYEQRIPLITQGNVMVEFEDRLFVFRREYANTEVKSCHSCKNGEIHEDVAGIMKMFPGLR